ncbi:MAG: VTT domain-containing protein [Candidatus Phosphoribacter sp.]
MFDNLPYPVVYVVFFLGVMVRANATYWLGRAARRGGENTRAARRLQRPMVRRAETLVARFGIPAVALSFLTVGVQTAINFAAGVLRMPLWRYEIGVVIGALAWAAIYSTIGFAVLGAWVGDNPWPAALALAGAVGVVVVATRIARRRMERTLPYAGLDIESSGRSDG